MSDALVSTEWVAERLETPGVRVIEASATTDAYASEHLPGADLIDWRRELIESEDESSGLVIDEERFASLASRLGIEPEDTLVFYGDQGGRHACRALWTFEYYRHPGALHVMDGGREAWEREGRPLTSKLPPERSSEYPTPAGGDERLRITRGEIESRLRDGTVTVLDTRTREEHEGRDVRAKRGGHIPGATHRFWREAVTDDEAFRTEGELGALYGDLPREGTVAVHCQLGVRSVHTWFVLRHVLGYENVRNYDGSWQEWGNVPETPIER